jgi:hypothetical protein
MNNTELAPAYSAAGSEPAEWERAINPPLHKKAAGLGRASGTA